VKTLRPKLKPEDEKLRATLDAFEKWDGRVNTESPVAPIIAQMRLAFRSKILAAALGPDLVRNYQWANFDTTLDRIIKEQPPILIRHSTASSKSSRLRGYRRNSQVTRICFGPATTTRSVILQRVLVQTRPSGPGATW